MPGASPRSTCCGAAREAPAFVWAFDLLELDGNDLRDLPLERRKGALKALL